MSSPIVFIDDEPIMCRAFSLALRRLGREVKTFTDPNEALAFLESSERPAVVVCDYRMPRLTGLEVRERLPTDLPFILISGDLAIAETASQGRGLTAFLAKPFPPEDLLAAIAPLLEPAGPPV